MVMPLPEPKEVRDTFARLLKDDPERAVAYLHELGIASGYLDEQALSRTIRWTGESDYGPLECSINLAKPEKDPRAIAAAAEPSHRSEQVKRPACHPERRPKAEVEGSHAATAEGIPTPLCDLCWENEGFPGTPEHPAKPGLRIAAIELGGERWGVQFSPYAYFPEHCIALSAEHRPMKIDAPCLERLLDFVEQFPFYFIGLNADLPIVGGSILSHDHFQGGRHVFPLMKAPVERPFLLLDEPVVRCGIVRWPASVVRLTSADRHALARAATRVLDAWRTFSFEPCGIRAYTGDIPHNTLNPIVRATEDGFVMDLVLRNNRTDAAHPWGIFHPGEHLHHLKKENIGLIEIMGLAIFPPRLARELPAVQQALIEAARTNPTTDDLRQAPANHTYDNLRERLLANPLTAPHTSWALDIFARRAPELASPAPTGEPAHPLHPVLRDEVTRTFATILETTAVFKPTPTGHTGWTAFLKALGTKNCPHLPK